VGLYIEVGKVGLVTMRHSVTPPYKLFVESISIALDRS
jgi:hypothetical protein